MTTIHVPSQYATISQAIANSSNGDTIIVAPAIYTEQVNIDKTLTLLGAQANVDARTRTFVAANESIITFASSNLPFGSGIINLSAPNIVLNGFTIQSTGTITDSTGGIFAGDIGQFLPNTTTIDVTGLQILNNIVQNNANGVLIASIEGTAKSPQNYLVQYNYFYNNSGNPNNGDGQGAFFGNSAGATYVMTNVVVTQNLFNGLETSASVNLTNVNVGSITNNVANQDNSISIFSGTTGVNITGNVSYQATGITPDYPTNTADAIFIGFGCANNTVTGNLIFNATGNGINLYQGNSNITITNNCIENNTTSGINLDNGGGTANSNIIINDNNIMGNATGLLLNAGSYTTPPELDASENYWGSSSGPNYNSGGPGTGEPITDNNTGNQSVNFISFLTAAMTCPSPLVLTKSSTSMNVTPGIPVSFDMSFTVAANGVPFVLNSFSDSLPPLISRSAWIITTKNPEGFFTIINTAASQQLTINDRLPITLAPGTYSATISANTTMADAGSVFSNITTMQIQIGGATGLNQSIISSATASVAICIHGSSRIKLANGEEIEISKIQPGEKILGGDDNISPVIEAVPCWAGIKNKIFTDCVIFEPNSISEGVPNYRLAIDPGHPICTPEEYLKEGNKALKPAKSYLKEKSIYTVKWNKVAALLPGENRRYDIIMSEDSCKTYIANGMVIQARKTRQQPGYKYN